MRDDAPIGSVEFTHSAGLVPWREPDEFVHEIKGVAYVLVEDGGEQAVGEITFKLILAGEAVNRGEALLDVCDAESALMEELHGTLFGEDGDTKEELGIEPAWNNILLIEGVEVEDAYPNK
jgi:hypothetical protein